MTLKSDTEESKASEPLTYRTITARWFGVLGPLAAVFGQQQLAYYFVLPACRRGFWPLLHLPPILALAVTLAAATIGWRELNQSGGWRGGDDPTRTGSAWFFGAVALILSGLAGVLILAQWIPSLLIPACQH
ncbi:MAG: hypothetical protein ACJ785_09955 [Gemmatimonadaceae bacterium]